LFNNLKIGDTTMIRIKFDKEEEGKAFVRGVIANGSYSKAIDLMGWEDNDFLIAVRFGSTLDNTKAAIIDCLNKCEVRNYKIEGC